jgi:hypothetical protein
MGEYAKYVTMTIHFPATEITGAFSQMLIHTLIVLLKLNQAANVKQTCPSICPSIHLATFFVYLSFHLVPIVYMN